jgi:hypothetical protein
MPLSLHNVRAIDARGGHANQHLSLTGLRDGPGGDTQLLGSAGRCDLDDCHLHALSLVGITRKAGPLASRPVIEL